MTRHYYIRHNNIISYEWRLDDRYNIGKTYEDSTRGKYVPLSKAQVEYLKRHQSATAYEVWHMTEQQPYTPTIEDIRVQKIAEIETYNNSDEVNSFTFMGRKMWVSLQERIAFRQAVEAKIALGIESITLPIEGLMSTPLPCATVKAMLDRLEVYASDADTKIKYHESVIRGLKNEEEINKYNYKEGMPSPLNFDNL